MPLCMIRQWTLPAGGRPGSGRLFKLAQQLLLPGVELGRHPVSYTHLDVYKRQAQMGVGGVLGFDGRELGNEENAAGHSVGPEKPCCPFSTEGMNPSDIKNSEGGMESPS